METAIIKERLSVAKTNILMNHHFWAVIALNAEFILDTLFGYPAATDCDKKVWINPNICKRFGDGEFLGLILHELLHNVFMTATRCNGRDWELWNRATDYAINLIIVDELKIKIPEGGCYDKRFKGMLAEEIYDILCQEEQQKKQRSGCNSDSDDLSQGDSGSAGNSTGNGKNKSGSGEDGDPDADAKNGNSSGGGYKPGDKHFDLHLPASNRPGAEKEMIDLIAQAKAAWDSAPASGRGTIGASLENYLDKLLKPQVPWERELHRYAGQVIGREDYSLSPPHRRYLMEDMIVPAAKSYHVGNLVVSIDSSGSVYTKKVMTIFASEVAKLAFLCEDCTVIVADCDIQQVIKTKDIVAFLNGSIKGGGGTSHIPVFEEIKKLKLDPELFIGLTDGDSCYPDKKPPFPVLWCLTQKDAVVPWGRKVFVDV